MHCTLLTLLRIPFLGRIRSISYVLPIRQNIDILNRDIRVNTVLRNSGFQVPNALFPVSTASANDQYGHGIHDPILQHQPVTNQYEVKRENPKQILATTAVGNDVNPFLRRRPKSVQVTVKRRDSLRRTGDDDQDGREGWIPIPYPIYKK